MTPRFWRLMTVLMAMMLALAACNGAAESTAPAAESEAPASEAPESEAAESEAAESEAPASEAAGEPELSEITVGTLPIVDVAAVHLAINDGFFADEGLTVTPEVMQGGAAAIPALQAGELDIAFGAWPSFLVANQQGIELVAVSDGVAATEGFTEYLALPDSGLEGNPEGLAGTTVALNTLGNVGELTLRAILADAGLAWEDVTPLEVPFPEMGAALDGGNVDAIFAVEPGVTGNKTNLGAVVVSDAYPDELEGFPVAGFFVTREFADQNPNTVAAFARAVQQAADMLNDDEQLRIDTVLTFTELPEALLENVTFPEFKGELDVASVERVYDTMLEYAMIEEGLDVASLVAN